MSNYRYRCVNAAGNHIKYVDDGFITKTCKEQANIEENIEKCFKYFTDLIDIGEGIPTLHRKKHEMFLLKGLQHLSEGYECLDASQPWLCYWILHSLELLAIPLPDQVGECVADFLEKCQCENGGFAGGPGQQAHLAPTYAAVNALCIIGTEYAYNKINRETLQKFLSSMKTPEGAFIMHEGGEEDIRGAYCALSAARLTNIAKSEMFDGTAEWIARCQTYEGGFAGVPETEAHGGYSFCGLAALVLLGKEHECNMKNLLRWTVNRQMSYEGGFQGRTNKLVDGCYSFWQGGVFPIIHMVLAKDGDADLSAENWMFNQGALQEYLLLCCQHPMGGLIDKPGKPRDYYHTCYCLSGMSVAQHFHGGKLDTTLVVGDLNNELRRTHPVINICTEAVQKADLYFQRLPIPETSS